MSWKIIFSDREFFRRARVIFLWRGMHAAKVLREEIFAVEVVVVESLIVIWVCRGWAEIAAPVAELDMLRADVPLPLVLG